MISKYRPQHPVSVGRIGEPEDLFKAVRFAIECDYVNGFCIDVDGGAAL